MKFIPQHIVITGASSGIGAALAKSYADDGVMLSLTGRNEERLAAVVKACEQKGAIVHFRIVDVRDREDMAQVMAYFDEQQPIGLVVANAGISAGTGGDFFGESPEQVREIFDVNLNGVLNTIDPVIPKMIERGRGQVALMSSIAGFCGFPGAPAYCASKAAVRIYGESLMGPLAKHGVLLSVICPGFVESGMTAVNQFKMPFIMPAMRGAQYIMRKLQAGKAMIIFPRRLYAFVWILLILPHFVLRFVLSFLPSKQQKG